MSTRVYKRERRRHRGIHSAAVEHKKDELCPIPHYSRRFGPERLWRRSNIRIRKDFRKFENYEGKRSGDLQRAPALIPHVPTVFSRSSSSTSCMSLIAGTRFSNYSFIYTFSRRLFLVALNERERERKWGGEQESDREKFLLLITSCAPPPFLARFSPSRSQRENYATT